MSRVGIFRFDIDTNTLSPIITSLWNDQRPSLSPANTKIAFVSDRSGRDEVWMYDIGVESYRQVTGSNAFGFDSRYSNLHWLDDSSLLITVSLDNGMTAVTINLINGSRNPYLEKSVTHSIKHIHGKRNA